eukprot:320083-Chlamydomonas_euryale.AAC.6
MHARADGCGVPGADPPAGSRSGGNSSSGIGSSSGGGSDGGGAGDGGRCRAARGAEESARAHAAGVLPGADATTAAVPLQQLRWPSGAWCYSRLRATWGHAALRRFGFDQRHVTRQIMALQDCRRSMPREFWAGAGAGAGAGASAGVLQSWAAPGDAGMPCLVAAAEAADALVTGSLALPELGALRAI